MALNLAREHLFRPCFFRCCLGKLLVASAIHTSPLVWDRVFTNRSYGRFQALDTLCKQHQLGKKQCFSTSFQSGMLCWEGSTRVVLLRKLEGSLKDHRVDESWIVFNDFKRLYGLPKKSLVFRLITELSYSSDPRWLQKACDLVILISKEKWRLFHPEILTKLSLSLARAQMPVLACVILRLMLESKGMPPMNVLCLVFSHMVKTKTGACLASNFLIQICDHFLSLSQRDGANMTKPNTMIFNLVLNACVRFKYSLKGQQIVELISQIGVIADAHSILVIAQIHEMNGQRDEMKKFKEHIDRVSAPFVHHYQQFYDSLLNLHFKFDDVDAAAELVLDLHRSVGSIHYQRINKGITSSCLVPIGSHSLKTGLKLQIMPELLQKDFTLAMEHKQELILCKNGKLFLSKRGLAKFINGFKRQGRIGELSKLLLSIHKVIDALGRFNLCSDVIKACICLGWLETAHDILDDMERAGALAESATYITLLTSYFSRQMLKEAKALLRQMRKAGMVNDLSDEMVASVCLSEAADSASFIDNLGLTDILVQELREEDNAIPSIAYSLNSSIYFFWKAKMMEDALKTYRRMQKIKIQPTMQTFAYLVFGYSSLERYRDITILWGDIKRNVVVGNLVVSRDLYECLLLNFLRGGYFERVMEVMTYMKEQKMCVDKWMYKSEFLKLHKNLYKNLKASDARTEAQKKRIECVQSFRKCVGID